MGEVIQFTRNTGQETATIEDYPLVEFDAVVTYNPNTENVEVTIQSEQDLNDNLLLVCDLLDTAARILRKHVDPPDEPEVPPAPTRWQRSGAWLGGWFWPVVAIAIIYGVFQL
jgi:hypothetical protein